MPRYIVERHFPDGLHIPLDEVGSRVVRGVVSNNAKNGVTWSDAQWRAWDAEYNRQREDEARAWLQAWYLMSQMAREQAIQEEFDRARRGSN